MIIRERITIVRGKAMIALEKAMIVIEKASIVLEIMRKKATLWIAFVALELRAAMRLRPCLSFLPYLQ